MKNFLFISPNFPQVYYKFVTALKNKGFNVLGIGDGPYYDLEEQLKKDITEYYFVNSLSNFEDVKNAVQFFINKYGPIDYIESNNEYWLVQDAKLREIFNIPNGLRPYEMDHIKYKSKMKDCFIDAGVKVARYTLVDNYENAKKFIDEVSYPVFVKPNMGVGACDSYAIHNDEELLNFINKEKHTQYIMEEYVEGEIVYYALKKFDNEFLELGKRVVKSFKIRKRCFHIEFFKLTKERLGLGDVGDIVAIEVNMRPPGGNTPDLLSICLNASFYDCYADIISDNKLSFPLSNDSYIAISVARKDRFNYVHNLNEIQNKYQSHFIENGRYNKEIALNMGDEYYFGRFNSVEDAIEFKNYIQDKQ